MKYETVIGIEVHAELNTQSKIFCGCPNAFGAVPNTHICPICSGQPGALPKLNEAVVECAVRLGLALSCKIAKKCNFDRKNYFYPDLPKAYQISQLYFPICTDGFLEIQTTNTPKRIGIREIHIEEDAGKLKLASLGRATQADLNRAGVPLLEIVTQPDFESGEEVIAFIERLREIMLYLDICDCKMQEGSLRADINLSLKQKDGELGTRTETKNLNSLKAVLRAVQYETARQAEILAKGGMVTQQTRRWDDEKAVSHPMRSKENAQDYRYFPEPDLPPLYISDGQIKKLSKSLPEFAHHKRRRFTQELGISPSAAEIICKSKNIAELFEAVAEGSGNSVEAANLITGDILRLIGEKGLDPEKICLDAAKLTSLIDMVTSGKINRGVYKEAVEAVFLHDADPTAYITQKGLFAVCDDALIRAAVTEAISKNPQAAADYTAGKEKAFACLMGQAMKHLSGKADPAAVRKMLVEVLKENV
ncbi:MAG: Asp-tRNA(Asn)/Glu-tRNA(Gln) amidotransferase subunit GatB [Firmicutes bacterium]|nr:Asp-tRNA(Asn)/Glu-tRNA(Gln) amidotransferase subunit GatB [Bacillota bacterium]